MGGRRGRPAAKPSLGAQDDELAKLERQLAAAKTPRQLADAALALHTKLWEVATYLAPFALKQGGDATTIATAASLIDRARVGAILASERAAIALVASGDLQGALYHLMQALAHGAAGDDRARVLDMLAQLVANAGTAAHERGSSRDSSRGSPAQLPATRAAGRGR